MTEPTEWQSDLRRAFAGLNEAIAKSMALVEAQKRRDGEEGYLLHHVAWECAQVEYTWRRKHEATRKGREQWQGLYKVVIANSRAHYEHLEREKGLRLTAEGDRDRYKELSEVRGRHILELSAALSRPRGGEPTFGRTCDDHGGDLLRERNDAIACAEILRKDLEKARRELKAAEESATAHRARADRIRDANIRLCALREADRAGRDADDVLTELRTTGVLITPRTGTRVLYVSRPGDGRDIGYLSPYALGWNAYVYRQIGPAEFVGWYKDTEEAAGTVDGSYHR